MQIFVKMLTGKLVVFDVEASDTVDSLKAQILVREHMPFNFWNSIRLCAGFGKQFEDGRMLSDYNIESNTTLHLLWRLGAAGQPSTMKLDGDVATLYNGQGTILATFGLKTSSCAERMQTGMSFVSAECLSGSRFQAVYRGTGAVRDVTTKEMLAGLVHLGVCCRSGDASNVATTEFTDTDGDSNHFVVKGKALWYTSSNSKCKDEQVTSLVREAYTLHCTMASGSGHAWEMAPPHAGVFQDIRRLAVLAGVPHNIEAIGTSFESQYIFYSELAELYKLDEPHGAAKLYTSDVQLFTQKLYRVVARSLTENDRVALDALAPYLIRLNRYVNETRHDATKVYCGGEVPEDSLPLLVPGSLVRVPRVLSTSAERGVAEQFKTNILLVVHIPGDFWGARSVRDISDFQAEEETLFCPYSQFVVLAWDARTREAEVAAVDKYYKSGLASGIVYSPGRYTTLSEAQRALLPK